MHIRVINPNTTRAMTDLIGRSARVVAAPGTVVDAVQPTMGPASIESHYEEALAVPGLLEQVALGESEGVDGYVVACFGDPGVDAARELARGPVIGIAEAAMHAAALVGRRFTVVTTLGRTTARARELADRYGFRESCVAVRACEISVLGLEQPGARERLTAECRRAVQQDGADAVVLGCAGMAELCAAIADDIGVPVVDGVAAGTVLVQSLLALGLRPGAGGEYAPPPAKPMSGLLAGFEIRADAAVPVAVA
ncbi:aspartate/glutamate racemase family protein [Cellulomonas fengjieae]|uniref:Aspartate/glutamate racemase family protein n=1 Tax=Cellulomonas fengjieae TaxID=2819978 RepID=A0ABS3SBP2_9CELL|nr:aspartate/glutamate racemase family protein [Cellulomonas fengjieae]MBO3083173.1 aspartate/glutamate racemase family protein [Cellulomonas fengjieae]MBO3102080.1 aspartate/glutamate racemase family protein [Cellulomonas fengjieae]QVI65468.1 aspartate/glutamate racemase family protein [Cellulomonas fengjieae]